MITCPQHDPYRNCQQTALLNTYVKLWEPQLFPMFCFIYYWQALNINGSLANKNCIIFPQLYNRQSGWQWLTTKLTNEGAVVTTAPHDAASFTISATTTLCMQQQHPALQGSFITVLAWPTLSGGDRQSTWSRGVTNLVLASLPVLYLPICYIYVHNKRLAGSIIADYSDWLINSFSLEITCKASYLPCWPVMAALPRTRLEWAMCSQYEWRSIPIKAIIHEPFWKPLS